MIGKSLCGGWLNRILYLHPIMKVKFDVMYNERYIKTFVYDNKSPFPPSEMEIRDFVISKLPTYRNKDFKIELYEQVKR